MKEFLRWKQKLSEEYSEPIEGGGAEGGLGGFRFEIIPLPKNVELLADVLFSASSWLIKKIR